eukprot:TRINITY_DN2755_c0_g1_i3.p1 TRINITY_DN2755_c0_g1~~TRINITY_DN2755_c0_g1_i3.p1  ORF type:complete len:165 (+),score=3.99 TRINITY_DN2755_c0_g1_i3:150-644(+)
MVTFAPCSIANIKACSHISRNATVVFTNKRCPHSDSWLSIFISFRCFRGGSKHQHRDSNGLLQSIEPPRDLGNLGLLRLRCFANSGLVTYDNNLEALIVERAQLVRNVRIKQGPCVSTMLKQTGVGKSAIEIKCSNLQTRERFTIVATKTHFRRVADVGCLKQH